MALAAGVLPLWVGRHLPLVDLPQHLHLISALHRLDDPTTLYPELLEARGELTPYLGYYYAASLLNWLLPLDVANKVFLSAYVAGLPLSVAFLLRAFGRPTWPALLTVPLAYGDSFGWGFVNYCASLPLTFLCMGAFVRCLQEPRRRKPWAVLLAVTLVGVLLMHVQAFAFLAFALPLLLVTTRAPEDAHLSGMERLGPRVAALVGVLPGVVLFLLWFGGRLSKPPEVAYGQPWKAWGPTFSPQNLNWKGGVRFPAPLAECLKAHVLQNWRELPSLPANLLRDGSDRYALYALCLVAAVALGLGIFGAVMRRTQAERREGPVERWRLLGLGAIALAMFFVLPFDINGYVYYLNTRYVHLALPLLVAALPLVEQRFVVPLRWAGAACAVVLALPLGRAFAEFNREMAPLDRIAEEAARKPRVMGLIYDTSSRVMTHPVFLHAASEIARAQGGITNFSFASTPHSPLKYKGEVPPTFPSEWRPWDLSMERQGYYYDHFLLRGRRPQQTALAPFLGSELVVADEQGPFTLVRRR
ncbi:MAG: hypothetical protein IRZ16_13005 [Myxococcaceae bacterium]|nr:hypothetical protein [Myxococcaceae bacterium]